MRWLALLLGLLLAQPAQASSTIDSLPPITQSPGVFPLPDPGCTNTSNTNFWISQGTGPTADFKIDALRAGFVLQSNVAPTCPFKYQLWWNTGSTPPSLNVYSGTTWVPVGWFDTTNNLWISSLSSGTIPTIASSTTTDLCQGGTVPNGTVNVSGNALITSFGSSCPVGARKIIVWQSTPTIQASNNIILPGGVNKTVSANDVWYLNYIGGGVWQQYFQSPGQQIVGTTVNVSADQVGVANPGLNITADSVSLGTSLFSSATILPAFGEAFNASLGGAGGMDTGAGTAPHNNFVAIYAIAGPAGVSTLGYTCSSSCPSLYPGANMPSGYTTSALLVVWPTDGSGNLVLGNWRGKRFQWSTNTPALNASSTPATTPTSINLLGSVPPNAIYASGRVSLNSTVSYAGGVPFINLRSDNIVPTPLAAAAGANLRTIIPASTAATLSTAFDLIMVTPKTLYYSTSSDISANLTATIGVFGYTIP
jgi:hypothetical protein